MSSLARDPKRVIAILIAGVVGILVLIDFAGPTPIVSLLARLLVDWAATLTAIALLIGLVSVAASHVQRVVRRSSDYWYSLILLLAMLTVIIVGVSQGSPAEGPVRTLFRTVYEPLASSLLALLAFFSLSAALRALQRRSLEATVIIAVAALVLLVQLPPVAALPYVESVANWFNNYVTLAGARGLLIGSALGALVAGVRVVLGFDTPYLDR
jgi:hypothetical protein